MRMWTRRSRTRRSAAAAVAGALCAALLAGCSANAQAGPGKPDGKITVWTLENLPARMAAEKKMISRFEKKSGVEVDLVGVDEGQLPQLIMSAAAAGNLPDVIGSLPLGQAWQMHGNGLLDTEGPAEVVEDLDPGTFNPTALKLTSDGGTRLSVPSDAWLQLLVYRKDLFKKAGLPAPDSYGKILEAAERLDRGRMDGISLATDPADAFTQQSFEDLALANDCQLVEKDEVALDSPACKRTFETYDTLAREHGGRGTQTVDTTRATYFAGRSPMMVWSSFLLDELSGERADVVPSCPECKKDRAFLAENSGITTALKGPDGEKPVQFGEITSWAMTKSAETEASKTFITYMLSSGYEDWFGMAPEGKIPVREGTPEDPDKYREAWRSSRLGVEATNRKPLNSIYSDALLDQLTDGVSAMRRWGFQQGEGALVGATNGELPVPKAVSAMTSGQTSPGEAAREAQDEVDALRRSLE
ncbi:multiple sugar transport system substrate-binding protein [Streptomyces sp. WMMB 714]|uniref:ABC transporter substrate-binding protein n=1 Tax=Streptomyces sp. WMMB 714 TaxID=1286822 RepID=UPI0005F872A0|nr:extracellular solute-binding protein [Streptomyces sp. WMMB 714]SCK18990.1 multiple sugar transport system substrate-binding protein [Streptomyces sp. WMMB 714]